jgi:hypothetical protein
VTCNRPPSGWFCTRAAGHEGPCAALPVSLPTWRDPWHDAWWEIRDAWRSRASLGYRHVAWVTYLALSLPLGYRVRCFTCRWIKTHWDPIVGAECEFCASCRDIERKLAVARADLTRLRDDTSERSAAAGYRLVTQDCGCQTSGNRCPVHSHP